MTTQQDRAEHYTTGLQIKYAHDEMETSRILFPLQLFAAEISRSADRGDTD